MSNKHLQKKKSIPHFYPTLHQVNTYNNNIKHNQSNFTIESTCTDILPASISKILETNITAAISKQKINHTGGLPETINLIANEQYDLISNINVNDGLINGTQSIVKYIYKQLNTMTTSCHISFGSTSKILISVQTTTKNTHTCIQHTTQTDNGCPSLK